MVKAVLLDLDGVLVDNVAYERANLKYVCNFIARKRMISAQRAEEDFWRVVAPFKGRKEWHDWRWACAALGAEKVWVEAHVRNLPKLKLVKGVEEVLEALSREYRLFVATDAISEVADIKLGYFGLLSRFEAIFSQDSMGEIKSSEDYFKHIMAATKLRPADMALVDNRLERGIATAAKLGFKTVYVPKKEHSHELIPGGLAKDGAQVKADRVVEDIRKLPEALELL